MLYNLETVKLVGMVFFVAVVYLYVQHDDYHKKFDKPIAIEYNCNNLQHDAPREVFNMCSKSNRRFVIVKAYQE